MSMSRRILRVRLPEKRADRRACLLVCAISNVSALAAEFQQKMTTIMLGPQQQTPSPIRPVAIETRAYPNR